MKKNTSQSDFSKTVSSIEESIADSTDMSVSLPSDKLKKADNLKKPVKSETKSDKSKSFKSSKAEQKSLKKSTSQSDFSKTVSSIEESITNTTDDFQHPRFMALLKSFFWSFRALRKSAGTYLT